MTKQEQYNLMDDMMSSITQADAWQQIDANDPFIQAAKEQFASALKKAEEICGWGIASEIDEANAAIMSAYADAGILYGMRVMLAIREVALNPRELSQIMVDRMAKSKEEVA